MDTDQIHYEVYTRRRINAPWTLQMAVENRARAVEAAEDMLADGSAAAVRVSKEILDPDTREFKTITVFSKGAVDAVKARKTRDTPDAPLCVSPADLYTIHARERIGRLLDGWLVRKAVTPFELLHRPDLIEQLDASGIEIQHAIQKVAIPEAQARGVSVHEVIRTFQKLVERAVERVMKDARSRNFPQIEASGFARAVEQVFDDPEPGYRLGAGVAAYLASGAGWREKVGLVLNLAEAAPDPSVLNGRARAMAFQVLEQPLSEMLGSRAGLADLLGPDLDLGGSLAALTRLTAGAEVAVLAKHDPTLAGQLPDLTGHAARLAGWMEQEAFSSVRSAIGRRILAELNGPRRLRPDSAEGEIAILRALALALTASAGRLLSPEDVQAAFIERSRRLVASDFVETYLSQREGALAEAQALVRLAENMAGAANKQAAARWISASVGALRFERDLREGAGSPGAKLAVLAALQKAVSQAGLSEGDCARATGKIGEIGGLVEADARLTALLARAEASPSQRLTLLLRLASGETAPLGPAADRAKAEAMRLLRAPEIRQALAADPQALERVRDLIQVSGLAA